ncbi:Similar to hypothetical protein MGG_02809 [Magnaporthe oryzae 70-15]; acc. no. XP_366733 [Pyronema omphalodes CBS 100304]|uniref:Uncharacterized protein n=1 Tax=Pyronema omphalodes (strain CBS 100304) TaxID=1076935 RepID=U4LNM5_PYROM|nr:Similar to hypothetical protein MGG_02809 [Magnaporthe oryzae 70-15]; acc. no. XP_366733 [Pyronema omphalodes CBS 100304]
MRIGKNNPCEVMVLWSGLLKPRAVVGSPEDAARRATRGYDYIIISLKSLPRMEVYDLASIFESVVTPG